MGIPLKLLSVRRVHYFNFSCTDSVILKSLGVELLKCVEDSLQQLWALFFSTLLLWASQWKIFSLFSYIIIVFQIVMQWLCRISLSLWLGNVWLIGWGTSLSRPCWGRRYPGLTGKLTPQEHYSLGWPLTQLLSKGSVSKCMNFKYTATCMLNAWIKTTLWSISHS